MLSCTDNRVVKHVHEHLVLFLNESHDEGVPKNRPKSLPTPDLKAIAMESDPKNSIQAGHYGGLV